MQQVSQDLGTDDHGWGFGGTEKKIHGKKFDSYGTTFGSKGDIVGTLIDLDKGEIVFFKNGQPLGLAFNLPKTKLGHAFYPAICTKNAPLRVNLDSDVSAPSNSVWVAKSSPGQFVTNPLDCAGQAGGKKGGPKSPRAIVIEPGRELAEQTFKWLQSLAKHLPGDAIKVLLAVGGQATKEQIQQLVSGVDKVVATPGRLDDLVNSGSLKLNKVLFYVMDEVDGLLKQGNKELICRLHRQMPRMFDDGKRLQMIVCSATLHNFDVKKLADDLMYFPAWVDLKGEDSVPETVHHVVVTIDPQKDMSWKVLKNPIRTDEVHKQDRMSVNQPDAETLSEAVKKLKGDLVIKAIDKFQMDQGIIFCRTKLDCDNLEKYFNLIGGGNRIIHAYTCVCLHADRKPQERSANLELFRGWL